MGIISDEWDDLAKSYGVSLPPIKKPASNQNLLDRVRESASAQESSGNTQAVNTRTGALGEFQVLPQNVPSWTKKHLGRSMSPDEFKNNPDAQRKVFDAEFGSYLDKALKTSPDEDTAIRKAAAAWYGGERAMHRYDDPKRFRPNEPSFREYTSSVLNRVKKKKFQAPDIDFDYLTSKYLGDAPDFDGLVQSYGIGSSQPVPESPDTLQAQYASALDPLSPRAAVLTTSPDQNAVFGNAQGFTAVPFKRDGYDGTLWVNTAKAKKLKLRSPQDIELYINNNPDGIAMLTGIPASANVGGQTSGGTAVTTTVNGNEAISTVAPTPESAAEIIKSHQAQFPSGQSQVVPTDVVAQARIAQNPELAAKNAELEAQGVAERYLDFNQPVETPQSSLVESPTVPSGGRLAKPRQTTNAPALNYGSNVAVGDEEYDEQGNVIQPQGRPMQAVTADEADNAVADTIQAKSVEDALGQLSAKYGIDPATVLADNPNLALSANGTIDVTFGDLKRMGVDAVQEKLAQGRIENPTLDLSLRRPTLPEADAEAALTANISDPVNAVQQIAGQRLTDTLSDPLTYVMPWLGIGKQAYKDFTDPVKLDEKYVQSEKERLLKQHGSYGKAWSAEEEYKNADILEKGIRMANQTGRSFLKNIVSGTGKGVIFAGQMIEDLLNKPTPLSIIPINKLLPDEYKIGARNAGNALDLVTRLLTSSDSTKAIEEWKKNYVAGDAPISDQQLFKVMQSFDKAIGDDPVLKGRFLGQLSDAGGSAAAFMALGLLTPQLSLTTRLGEFGVAPALWGALSQTGTGYEEGKQSGLDENKARSYGMIQGLLGMTEGFGLGGTVGRLIKNPTVRGQLAEGILDVAKKGILKEGGEEFLQELTQSTGGKVALEYLKDKEPDVYTKVVNAFKKLPAQVAQTVTNEGLVAMLTGGATGGAARTAQIASAPVEVDGDGSGDTKNKGSRYITEDVSAPTTQAQDVSIKVENDDIKVNDKTLPKPSAPTNETVEIPTTEVDAPKKEKVEKPRPLSNTQIEFSKEQAKPFEQFRKDVIDISDIADKSLLPPYAGDGLNSIEPHITVKYGLHTMDGKDVEPILKGEKPIELTLGKTSVFTGSEKKIPGTDKPVPYDVVTVEVDSKDLARLNKKLTDETENTTTFNEYKPHVTLAYVKSGEGKKYAGRTDFEGQKYTFDGVTFSPADKSGKSVIPLKAPVTPSPIRERAKKLGLFAKGEDVAVIDEPVSPSYSKSRDEIESEMKDEFRRRQKAGEKLPLDLNAKNDKMFERKLGKYIAGMSDSFVRDWHDTIFGKATPTEASVSKEPHEMTRDEFAKNATVNRGNNYISVRTPHDSSSFVIRTLDTAKYTDEKAIEAAHKDYIRKATEDGKITPAEAARTALQARKAEKERVKAEKLGKVKPAVKADQKATVKSAGAIAVPRSAVKRYAYADEVADQISTDDFKAAEKRSQLEKPSARTGFTKTQTEYLAKALQDYAKDYKPEKYAGNSKDEFFTYQDGRENRDALKRSYRTEELQPETIAVPDDGVIRITDLQQANRLHQRITGKPLKGQPTEKLPSKTPTPRPSSPTPKLNLTTSEKARVFKGLNKEWDTFEMDVPIADVDANLIGDKSLESSYNSKLGTGWLDTKVGKDKAFTNGHMVLVTDVAPGKGNTIKSPDSNLVIKEATKGDIQQVNPVKAIAQNNGSPLIIFDNGVAVQFDYYNLIKSHYPNVTFKQGLAGQPILAVDGKKIVGAVMPVFGDFSKDTALRSIPTENPLDSVYNDENDTRGIRSRSGTTSGVDSQGQRSGNRGSESSVETTTDARGNARTGQTARLDIRPNESSRNSTSPRSGLDVGERLPNTRRNRASDTSRDQSGRTRPDATVRPEAGRRGEDTRYNKIEDDALRSVPTGKTDTPAFKNWFKDSKVVDDKGQPLVVYHGTANDFDTFQSTPSKRTSGFGSLKDVQSPSFFFTPNEDVAKMFASNRADYQFDRPWLGKVMPVYLSIQKPLDLSRKNDATINKLKKIGIDLYKHFGYVSHDWGNPDYAANLEADASDFWTIADKPDWVAKIKEDGYDGIIFNEGRHAEDSFQKDKRKGRGKSYAVFNPTQIKSAIGNKGTFDPNDPSILRKIREADDLDDLNKLAKSKDFRAIVPNIKTSVIGDESGNNILSLDTNEAIELARTLHAIASDSDRDTAPVLQGVFLDKQQVQDFREAAEGMIESAEENDVDATQLREFVKNLDKAAKENGVVRLEGFEDAREHETIHQASYLASEGKKIEARYATSKELRSDPDFQQFHKALNRLQGDTSHGVALDEALAYLGSGDYKRFGLTREQSVNILQKLVSGFAEANGIESLKHFQPNTELYENIESYRKSQSREVSDDSGSNVSRQREAGRETSTKEPDEDGDSEREKAFTPAGKEKLSQSPKTMRGNVAAFDKVEDRSYTSTTNAERMEFANDILDKGVDSARTWLEQQLADDNNNAGATQAVGLSLMNHYAKNGGIEAMNDIAKKIIKKGTDNAQAVQAMSIVSQFDPESAAAYASLLKQRRTGKDLTPQERDKATNIAENLDETAKVDALGEAALKDAENLINELREENNAIQDALDAAPSKTDVANLKRQLTRWKNKALGISNTVGRVTRTHSELLNRKDDIMARLREKFPDKVAVLRMVAWHGSPHRFDKFDSSKIGTGAGAPNYGVGLYFTTKKSLADYYRKLNFVDVEGRAIAYKDVLDGWKVGYGNKNLSRHATEAEANQARDEFNKKKFGALYQVDLKPAEDEFLLWDQPLEKQSEKIQNVIAEIDGVPQGLDGGEFYDWMAALLGSPEAASRELLSFGIRGTKYIDVASSDKSFNYVIFDDADVEIQEVLRSVPSAQFDDNTRQDLIDYTALQILDGKSYNDTIKNLSEITSDTLNTDEVKAIHAAAVASIRGESPTANMTAEKLAEVRAKIKIRNEHKSKAREFNGANKNPNLSRLERELLDIAPDDRTRLASLILARTPDVHTWFDMVEQTYPEMTKPEKKALYTKATDLKKEAQLNLKKRSIENRKNIKLAEGDLERIREEKRVNMVNARRTQKDAENFYNGLVRTKGDVTAETIVNLRRANLLTGVKTQFRNIFGNIGFGTSEEIARPLSWLADAAAGLKTGESTVQGIAPKAITKSFANIFRTDDTLKNIDRISGLRAAKNILTYGDSMENLERQQHGESILSEKFTGAVSNKIAKGLDTYINAVFRTLGAEDAVFKVYAFRRSLEEQAKTLAKSKAERQELILNPTETMIQVADDFSLFMTFQNDNVLSNAFARFKKIHPAIKTISTTIVPYDRTPTNIVLRVTEHLPVVGLGIAAKKAYNIGKEADKPFRNRFRGPVERDLSKTADWANMDAQAKRKAIDEGIAKVWTREQQARFARTFGRAGLGTSLFATGFGLAAMGLLTGSMAPDDDDKAETNEFFKRKQKGIENKSLRIPGVGRFVLLDDPASKTLAAGATFYEQTQMAKGDSVIKAWEGAKESVLSGILFEQPLLSQTGQLYTSIKKGKIGEVTGNIAGGYVPTLISDIGEIEDEKPRTTSGYRKNSPKTWRGWVDTQGRGFRNSTLRRVPLVRRYADESKATVPPEVRGGMLRRAVRSTIDIFNTRPDQPYAPPKR